MDILSQLGGLEASVLSGATVTEAPVERKVLRKVPAPLGLEGPEHFEALWRSVFLS